MTSNRCEHSVSVGASRVNMLEERGGVVVCGQCDARFVPSDVLEGVDGVHQLISNVLGMADHIAKAGGGGILIRHARVLAARIDAVLGKR